MRSLLAVVLVAALPAWSQEQLTPPPPPPSDEQQPAAEPPREVAQPTYSERCFGYPSHLYVDPVPLHGGVQVSGSGGVGGSSKPSASSSGGGGSGGSGDCALILAVVIAALLPIVIYAVDEDAPPLVLQRFQCPSFTFEGFGGVEVAGRGTTFSNVVTGRFTLAYANLGTDFQFDLGPADSGAISAHLLARLSPKAHVEPAIAIGYRRLGVNGSFRDGLEVGLPHRYALFRWELRTLGLEVRPMLTFGASGIDASLEAALVLPLFEFLHLRVGGRVYSFGSTVIWGFSAGLNLTL